MTAPDRRSTPPSTAVAEQPIPADVRTIYLGGEVRPHFVGTRWGVRLWLGHPHYERVDEYENREKAEQMLRDVYGDGCTLVCREVSPWLVSDEKQSADPAQAGER